MIVLHGIVIFDISAVIGILVIAYLSKIIGEALKIPSFYKVLYFSAFLIIAAAIADTLPGNLPFSISKTISMGFRCTAGLFALPVCLRYWKWLISEFFSK